MGPQQFGRVTMRTEVGRTEARKTTAKRVENWWERACAGQFKSSGPDLLHKKPFGQQLEGLFSFVSQLFSRVEVSSIRFNLKEDIFAHWP